MDTMIFKMQCLFIYVVLFAISTCSATNEPASPSITVKEDFNSPAIITPISGYGPPPMVSNFVHQGTNFFFNPQFLLGNNVPPPLGAVVAAIPNPPNVEVILNQTVITPELPIVTPVEVIVEEPIEVIAPPPPPPSLIPVIPEVPEVPVLIRTIPPAPVLPPLVLPKIPVWVEESIEVVPPCEEKHIVITEVKPLPPVVIPQPPSLPPLVLPPKISVTEIEIKSQQPVDAATAVPIVPNKDVSMEFSKLKLTNEESLQVISATPVEEIDFKINEIPSSIEFPDFDKLLSVGEDKRVIMIPSPELPVIEIPKPISEVLLIEKDKKLVLPTQLPTDCARDIVLERVLPNMISKKTVTKSLEIISFPAAKYPVIAPLYPTL